MFRALRKKGFQMFKALQDMSNWVWSRISGTPKAPDALDTEAPITIGDKKVEPTEGTLNRDTPITPDEAKQLAAEFHEMLRESPEEPSPSLAPAFSEDEDGPEMTDAEFEALEREADDQLRQSGHYTGPLIPSINREPDPTDEELDQFINGADVDEPPQNKPR